MGTYLMMLYVSVEQELAVKDLFIDRGWGFQKPDLRMTTDEVGPLTECAEEHVLQEPALEVVVEQEQPVENNTKSKKAATKRRSKPSPASKAKKNIPKLILRKKDKKSSESAEFQEILEEAELIAGSVNQMTDENDSAAGVASVKIEQASDEEADDSADTDSADEENSDSDYDVTPSTSKLDDSGDTGLDTSASGEPSTAKKRKISKKGSTPNTLKSEAKTNPRGVYRQQYSHSTLVLAYQAVKETGMSIAGASKLYNVPDSTLRDRLFGRVDLLTTTVGCKTVLSNKEESKLIQLLQTFSKLGYRIWRNKVIEMASDYCVSLKKRSVNETFKNKWYYGFVKRWPIVKDLVTKEGDKKVPDVPITSVITFYYSELEKVLIKQRFIDKPHAIYSMSDLEITHENQTTRTTEALVTILACGNADGVVMPPYFVYHDAARSSPDELIGETDKGIHSYVLKDGELNFEVFTEFLEEHFIKNIAFDLAQQPVLLLVDGNKFCSSVALMDLAESHNIVLLFSPAKITRALQPLDLECFGPFRQLFQSECQKLILKTSVDISLTNVGNLACSAYDKAFSCKSIREGFRKTGIFPFRKDALTVDEDESEITLNA